MKMRSPIVAMLWENWRLTRVEAAQRFGLGIVAGSAAMMLFDAGATIAFGILVLVHGIIWMSIAKLNGGRFMDGYKPGFPLYLLYARPLPTAVIVGVPMAYDAISCVALYLLSAVLVGFAFGQPLPLFSVTLFIVAFHLAYACCQWSTRNRVVQWLGQMAFVLAFFFLLKNRAALTLEIEFSLVENAAMALFCFVAFGVTVAGVARQRRGGAVPTAPRTVGSGGYPDWLINLLRFPCPTSSAARAQMWFELKSSGLPVLAIGFGLAMLILLLFAISIPIWIVRPFAVVSVLISAPAVLLFLGGNAFGIRRRQGRTYLSAFEATQPYGTAQLASLKILVRTVCMLIALIAIGVSAWTSSSLVSAWGEWWVHGENASVDLLRVRREIGVAFGGLTGYALSAQAVILAVQVALIVATLAAFTALRTRYPRRLLVAVALLLLYGFALVLIALAERKGIASSFLLDAMLSATGWLAVAAIVFGTAYLVWGAFADWLFTLRQGSAVVLVSTALGAASVMMLRAAPMQFGGMATHAVWILSLALLPLMASVLAPWSLHRLRHM